MHKPSLSQLVYNAIFPKPRTNEPSSFASLITRHLVPEVRIETSTFYGTLDCIEAQYPGLDYSYPPHRMRLGRFTWHRKLFKAFDELGLTEAEIASLCRWEGTKSARDRYERDEAVQVRDTTADDIRAATPPIPPSVYIHSYEEESPRNQHAREPAVECEFPELEIISELQSEEEDESETSDDGAEMESYGVTLNRRLIQAAEARQQGADVSLDEDWEQWLKEASERNGYTEMIDAIRTGQPLNMSFTNLPVHSPSSSSSTSTGGLYSHRTPRPTNSSQRSAPISNGLGTAGPALLSPSITTRRAVGSSSSPAT
ncbi:hypothetical protein PAAG_00960 [Paracoccidioides lutzii Pb01]|uniref:Uncharacterized protein n=1 Tax=Paracoccidioides lutzii (strain ATCC MYA-826 / Pb01) TaxID=502779 RepID=C1GR15_PARBA|nr:hypothetical protein PAAG_00960 [Paracoccidioides lutzii Pb01]EEH38039.1 hypothetical protein PAAG_00960 [Paracoccidioides lutzii Pb01]